MADLKMQYQDASIDINAGLGGLHTVTVKCRNYTATFSPNQLNYLMAMLYPAIDAAAKPFDKPLGAP
jgi:hypothetical protein